MSTPAAKRQRTEAASNALSKPFCSPFKTVQPTSQVNDQNLPRKHSPHDSRVVQDKIPAIRQREQPIATPLRAKAAKNAFTSPISNVVLNADPNIAPLLKRQRELEMELRKLKEDLNIAVQARKIEVESEKRYPGGEVDGELLELIRKWKGASRQAADELFTGVRDRVNRMGGPKAWKEMQQRQKEFQSGWDEERPQPNSDDEAAEDVEQRSSYDHYDVDPETVNEREAREANNTPGDDEDEFTMATMLRTLNVDLSVIGYDKEGERWEEL